MHVSSVRTSIRIGVTTTLAAVLLFALLPVRGSAQTDASCLNCHADERIGMSFDTNALAGSVHSDFSCIDCHADLSGTVKDHWTDLTDVLNPATALCSPPPISFWKKRFDGKKGTTQWFPGTVKPVNCADCHEEEVLVYSKSEHGRAATNGVKQAATCLDCHGLPHAMLSAEDTNAPTYYAHIPDTCGKCHAKPEVMALYKPYRQQAVVEYSKSVHGISLLRDGKRRDGKHAAVCTDCHSSHGIQKGTHPSSPMFWQKLPATCGKCHGKIKRTFVASVHGKAVAAGQRDAPVCTDCHGEHTIAAVKAATSNVSPANIPETCGQCHASERITTRYTLAAGVLDTYMQSFHGLAVQLGGVAAANCASCHGYHDIVPSSDPASSIHRSNLPRTCGKCHSGIGTRLAQVGLRIHEPPGAAPGKPAIVNIVSVTYVNLIILIVGGMFVFNGLDYVAKVRTHARAVRANPRAEERMTPWVRAQHAVLLITFVLLAYTGFVHKFPDAFWSWPFRVLPDGSHWRGLLHRLAGWVFIALFVLHLVLLVATTRGRAYLGQLRPRSHDAVDALRLLRHNLGFRVARPGPRHYNFAEKAEYWALIWGSFVMILTGVMLVFTNVVLRLWSEVWLEVAQVVHYYEAVLATLAIIVWHFYWVIFDPREYPMNPSWLIGLKKPEDSRPEETQEA